MRNNILKYINNAFSKGHERSVKAKKNILASFMIKGLSIAISLVLVPLTIHYVNPSRYGIWITLSSIVGWFSFFDIGFGNGLRNKFAISVAKGEHEKARIYVSTTYAMLSVIIIAVLVMFFCINPFLNWSKILNAPPKMEGELSLLALIIFVFFCLQLEFQLIGTVLTANQQPAKGSLFNLIGSSLSLLIIFVLTKTTSGNLLYLGAAISAAPVIVLIISSIWYYSREYKMYAPSIKFVKFSYGRDLMGLGMNFFLLQIAGVVLYETNNIIIAQLFGTTEVTSYNIAYKYFSVITMVTATVMLPFWSAYTEAWTKNDIAWIRSSLKKLKLLWLLISIAAVFMFLFSGFFYRIWVGKGIYVPASISAIMAVYVIMNGWNNIYTLFLNGAGKIKLQLYGSVIGMIINIPLSIYLGKLFGIAGVLLATVILCAINMVIEPIQTNKLLNNNAKGIWNK
jgi:O-antigen/teichoic acid export membrane protein